MAASRARVRIEMSLRRIESIGSPGSAGFCSPAGLYRIPGGSPSGTKRERARRAGCLFRSVSNDMSEGKGSKPSVEGMAMTELKPHFIWYELMTTDQDAAERFYRDVVGWKTADAGQPGLRYTILSAGDRGMGGVVALPAEACKAGARPGWFGYVGVPDTDGAAKRIVEAGGSIHKSPENIPNVGRFAVVADPGGAAFMLLTPLPRQDEPPPADPKTLGLVSWHELYASNGERAAFEFYQSQFGWETLELMDMGEMG